jgi:hypothetical protein
MTTGLLSSSDITQDVLTSIFKTISDNELFVCSLCACMCTHQNKHQLVSTQCGHVFGKNCIRKQLKQTNQCPLCRKSLSTRREQQLRTMCLSSVVTIFPIEIARIRDERQQLRMTYNKITKRLERTKTKLQKNKQRLRIINKNMLRQLNRQ